MLIYRGLSLQTNVSKMFSRFYAKKAKGTKAPPPETDVLTNPNGKHLDAFMECHGNDRTVFKKEDIIQWKNCVDDYKFKLTCLKGTTKVMGCSHFCTFHPLDPEEESVVFTGFGWIAPEYRNMWMMKLQHDICHEIVPDPKTNVLSHINEPGRNFWHMMCGLKEHDDIGSNTGDVQYKSFYNSKDMRVPEDLDFSGIKIQNARDVPKKDIIEYDQTIHPYHREKYIISHMYDRDGYAKVAYDVNGKVIGIGQSIIYENKRDCNLGPIYADEPRVAQALFAAMLKEIQEEGKEVSQFEVRSTQMSVNSFNWIALFLKVQPSRSHVCNLVYKHWAPKNIDFSKVYCPTHAQLFLV